MLIVVQWILMEYGADDYGFGGEGDDAVDDEDIMAAIASVARVQADDDDDDDDDAGEGPAPK